MPQAEKMLISDAASNGLTPSSAEYAWLTSPAVGPPSSTHAKAPIKGGVTNEARIRMRHQRLPGRSVRETSHAIGAAAITQARPTAADVHNVVHSGRTNAGSTTS